MNVALQTNCWERDWRRVLDSDRLEVLASNHDISFASKTLLINRIANYSKPTRLAERAIERGWLSHYVIVEEHADAAMESFELDRSLLGRAYNYSIAQLVGLYLCRAEFLLYYMGDCLPETTSQWLSKAHALLESDTRVKVANLAWDGNYAEVKSESSSETEDFYLGPGFSDQCYLVRTAELRQPIYSHTHTASDRFPLYAGESFEKRVDSWMHCHGHLRATYKHAAYLHQNMPLPLAHRLKRKAAALVRSLASPFQNGGNL